MQAKYREISTKQRERTQQLKQALSWTFPSVYCQVSELVDLGENRKILQYNTDIKLNQLMPGYDSVTSKF